MKRTIIVTGFLFLVLGITGQDKQITLSGVILCTDVTMGPLNSVNIYNNNSEQGATSNSEGEFSIKMTKNDTIVFSTIQHAQQKFYFKEGEVFQDRNIEIAMLMDTVYLEVLDVMGVQKFDEFQKEFLKLDLPPNDITLATPVINKYAMQNASGDGAVDLKTPLTHLAKKAHFIKSQDKNKIKFDY